MRKIFCGIFLMSLQLSFSQGTQGNETKTSLPEIAPPSSTVASLMKFEEVGVNNYNGIPDISIPFYNVNTHSKNLSVNLSLSYHPYSAAADEVASSTGLGWNLMAGGTISRTVMGFPDEHYKMGSPVQMGIYQNEPAGAFGNTYYQAMESFNGAGSAVMKKFLWDAHQKGRYDTEHDLYQFNFMGRSGRFIIKKNTQGILEVSKLSNSDALDISFSYNYNASTRKYDFIGFTILDEKGSRYIFDITEKTTQGTFTQSIYFGNNEIATSGDSYDYVSAFHLSKVYDSSNNLVVSFQYNDDLHPITETTSDVSSEHNLIIGMNPVGNFLNTCPEQVRNIEPLSYSRNATRITKTKKLQAIEITDTAKIEFVNEMGRQDYNLINNTTASRLKSVVLKNWFGEPIKRFDLAYSYSEISSTYGKRMILSKVEECNFIDQKKLTHELYYGQSSAGSRPVGKDAWGFFNARPYNAAIGTYRETDPAMIKTDVLQKIKLPTGGAAIFDFESNTYSYIGDQPLSDYDGNPENWNNSESTLNFTSSSGASPGQLLAISTASGTYVKFSPALLSGTSMGAFTIRKHLDNGSSTVFSQFNCGSDLSCSSEEIYFPPGAATYTLAYNWFDATASSSVAVNVNYRTRIDSGRHPQPLKEYLHGGGMRIRNIAHFEDGNVPQAYFDSPLNQDGFTPAHIKNYSYNFVDSARKSSGSLVFGKPIFAYIKNKAHDITCHGFATSTSLTYQTTGQVNNLLSMRTQGADVGYQNVTVRQTGNGRMEFFYTSPIDVPQGPEAYTQTFPFLASSNLDYQRGILKKEKAFREDGLLLQETDYSYEIDEAEQVTGLKMFDGATRCAFSRRFLTYEDYQSTKEQCMYDMASSIYCSTVCFDDVFSYVGFKQSIETYGWVKLEDKTTKKYFGNEMLSEREAYTYLDSNKQLSSQTHFKNMVTGAFTKSEYEYHLFPGNRISEIATITSLDEAQVLSKVRNDYASLNGKYILSAVSVAKGNAALEQRLKYNLYDMWDNLLEVQQENGTKISYIWGYGGTQPLAKLENIAYSAIPANLVTAMQDASNAVPYNEQALLSALSSLRSSAALAGAMITTFTYKPLVGISTVTDSKGDRTAYEYDSFGRLQKVRDKDGNVLSENQYHYRTQN